MRFLCLCPTYKKPWSLIQESVACFTSQTHKNKFLMVYDDLGVFPEQVHEEWCVLSTPEREPDMVSKYQKMLKLSERFGKFDAVAIWDDDDIYLPEHLSLHGMVLATHELSYPKAIWSTYKAEDEKYGRRREDSGGRFWASAAIRMDALASHGFLMDRAVGFDLANLHRWQRLCSVGCPCEFGEPTYVYRWDDTGSWHASSSIFSKHHRDEEWYDRIGRH